LRPLKILLYVAITTDAERSTRLEPPSLKRIAVQLLDIAWAFLARRVSTHFYHWEVRNSNKGDIAIRLAITEQLVRAFHPVPVEIEQLQWGNLTAERAAAINRDFDLCVIGGSGYLFPIFGRFPSRFFEDVRALRLINCRKIAYGLGWNSILGQTADLEPDSSRALQAFIAGLDAVSVRDRNAEQAIFAATGTLAAVTGDPALYDGNGRPRGTARQPKGRLRIGINLACHGIITARHLERDLDNIAIVAKALRKKYNAELHYVAHAGSERLAWWLLASRGVITQWHDTPPERLVELYGTLDFHVSQMMHSAILALRAGVPTIAMAYDEKTAALFDLLGIPELCVPITDWDPADILSRFDEMTENCDELRARFSARIASLRGEAARFLERISREERDGIRCA